MLLFIDTETRSPVAIRNGLARYATAAEVIIVSWAVDYGKAHVWDVTSKRPAPPPLIDAITNADEIWAHNAPFDRTVLANAPWCPPIPFEKWRCSMVLALAHGLPGALDKLCDIFKIGSNKAKLDGKSYIQRFCTPKNTGAFSDSESHPAEWREFLEYARRDVPAMQEIHRTCPNWNYAGSTPTGKRMLALWQLDQISNDRGFAVDVEFAAAAKRATEAEKKKLGARIQDLTLYDEDAGVGVRAATQRDKLIRCLLNDYGVSLPDLKADTLERRINDPELPDFVKEILRIRLRAGKASTSKYKRLLDMSVAGRMYHTTQFCGAHRTGRAGGRGFQPQNQPRPTHTYAEIEAGIEAMKAGCEDLITDNVMALASSCIRSAIVAAPGHKLVVSDLANIEGRILAWLAGEEWKLQAFAAYDAGTGPDLYKVAYARAFGISPDEVEDGSTERQIGKVMELALGYGGGVGAFVTMAITYKLDLDKLASAAWNLIPQAIRLDAVNEWRRVKRRNGTLGLTERVYVVCASLRTMWRNAHPGTVDLWRSAENAMRNAISNPGIKFKAERLTFVRQKAWLYMSLPSGRLLCYPQPKIEGNVVSYMGVCTYTKRWKRISTWSGKIIENADQAIAYDKLGYAIPKAEDAGYPIVLTVHDELMAEVPDSDRFSHEELSSILAENDDWNEGLPLSAAGMTTYRYRKG